MFNISRITFTVLTFRVIVKEVLPKVLLQIQGKQWWQKLNLFISYARVSHEMAQFVLKIAHLGILMEPTPLLEKVLVAVSYPDYGSWIQLNNSCAMHCSHRKTSRSAVHLWSGFVCKSSTFFLLQVLLRHSLIPYFPVCIPSIYGRAPNLSFVRLILLAGFFISSR